jgi:DNA-binding protein YbaB
MGLFDKAKKAAQQAQQAMAQQGAPQQDGRVHVQNAGGMIDPAVIGGPSTRSVAGDDPIWEPINGISLQDYAELAREAQGRGVTDEAGMIAIAQERGLNPADTKAALDGWVQRMGQSMAVGQQFRKFLGY